MYVPTHVTVINYIYIYSIKIDNYVSYIKLWKELDSDKYLTFLVAEILSGGM